MFNEIIPILYGTLIWQMWRLRFSLNQGKIVLVLVNENKKLDYYALAHLNDFIDRKCANEVILIFKDKTTYKLIKKMKFSFSVKVHQCSKCEIEKIYRYYSFYNFSDKIVFTYTTYPKDNLLGKVLKETSINEEEAACLGLYHLRTIPKLRHRK